MSTSPQEILFRCDADGRIGGGHLMRCIALAEACAERGHRITFASHELSSRDHGRLEERGFSHVSIPEELREQRAWLGGLKDTRLVLDRYGLPEDYLRDWSAGPALQIVDGPEVLKGVDIALNQNLDGRVTSREGRLDLCGLDYALLRAEFRNASPIDPSMNVRRLLVTLGAADPDGHTGPLLETLGPLAQGNDLTVVVVIGGHNERRDELMEIARVSPWVEAHEDVADMARLMSTCQLALSASGSTLWELCALGLPRAVLSLAPNQEPLAVAAEAHGAAVNLGRSEALEHQNVASALKGLIADPKRRESQARAGRSMVDGQGAHRVAQALSEAT